MVFIGGRERWRVPPRQCVNTAGDAPLKNPVSHHSRRVAVTWGINLHMLRHKSSKFTIVQTALFTSVLQYSRQKCLLCD